MTLILYGLVFGPIIWGLTQYLIKAKWMESLGWVFKLILFALSLGCLFKVQTQTLSLQLTPAPLPYGMMLSVDTLSATFLILNNFLFLILTLFASKGKYSESVFSFLFLVLQGLINGIFLSTDLFNIYLLIEVSTIAISILIMYKKDKPSLYDGMFYFAINMVAMAFFLFGVVMLYKRFGVLDLFHLKEALGEASRNKSLILPLSFLFTSAALKAAVFPLYNWLPKAHGIPSAPSIVSAVLSGIFVKIGVYLLIRLNMLFMDVIPLNGIIMVLGLISALMGVTFAVAQTDIKLLLSYHTISQVGLILAGVGGSLMINQAGGLYHLVSHGLFKPLFFVSSGILIEWYGTRNIKDMQGLWQRSRGLSIALIIAILCITGAPFFSIKTAIYEGQDNLFIRSLFLLINMGTMMSFIKFIEMIFSKNRAELSKSGFVSRPIKKEEWLSLKLLALASATLGLFSRTISPVLVNYSFEYTFIDRLIKWPSYLFTFGIAFVLYKTFFKDNKLIKLIRKFDLTFNETNIVLVSFFFIILLWIDYL